MVNKRRGVGKRGQAAAGAAVLLAIIMGLIILFIILIPPERRAELLGEKPAVGPVAGEEKGVVKEAVKEELLRETPGHLTYLKEEEIEKLMPAMHIFTKTEAEVLGERDYLTVKKTVFSAQEEEIPFGIEDLENTENVLLDFIIESYQGNLVILLNEKEIFNRETNKFKPLELPKYLLGEENILTFKVSSPGAAFWRTNQYNLKNMKIVGEVRDVSAQEGKHLFYISPDEISNIEEASLRFSLSCVPEKRGKLEVRLNEYLVFGGVPENCEDLFRYNLPPEMMDSGNNWLAFKTKEGDYEISHIALKIKLKAPSYPTYSFEINKKYFTTVSKEEGKCGEIDGVCPEDCDEDMDKDCCFREYVTPYWCDAPTSNSDDRCVGKVEKEDCGRCASGYEDKNGYAPENCEKLCGDDKDEVCPAGCGAKYDKDCCFKQSGEQFWCSDLPTSGIDFSCVDSVSYDECGVCASGYEGEESSPDCPVKEGEEEEKLKEAYKVILTLKFMGEEKKEADIYINGHKISFDTYKVEFSYNIKEYVRPWANSLKIVPKTSFDVGELTVELKS